MSIRKQAVSGVKWTTLGTIMIAVTGLIKISVLARFLNKEDFGLMALVTFVLGFMNLFMDVGLTTAILHKQEISKKEYSSLYWINIILSIILLGVISLVSPLVASFYDEPDLKALIPLMGISIMFSAMGNQFKTVEQKEMNYKYISIVDVAAALIGLIAAIVFAIKGFGVYSLVYAALLQYAISNVAFFLNGIRKRGIMFHFDLAETKPFLSIGMYYTGGQVVNYFNRDLDILIIGKFFSTEILGGYSLAKQLIRRPIQIINPILNKVAFSVFPRYQNDHNSLRIYFTKLFKGMGALNALIYGFSAIFAPYLVLLFYGPDFSSVVIYVQLFAVVMYLRSMGGIVSILVVTTGRTDYEFYWNLLVAVIMPSAIIVGSLYSVEMVIIMMALVQLLLLFPVWYIFYNKLISLDFFPLLNSHIIPLIFAISFFCLSQLVSMNIYWYSLASGLLSITLLIYSYLGIHEIGSYLKEISRFNQFSNRK